MNKGLRRLRVPRREMRAVGRFCLHLSTAPPIGRCGYSGPHAFTRGRRQAFRSAPLRLVLAGSSPGCIGAEGVRVGVSDSHQTDGELLFSLGRGDASAYRVLFQRHERSAYRVALAMMRSPWDAEEVVSASFLELWRKREKVRLVDGSVLPWLFTVISYQAKNHTRAGLRYRRLLSKIPRTDDEPDHADEVARMVDAVPMSSAVQQALSELNSRDASYCRGCAA